MTAAPSERAHPHHESPRWVAHQDALIARARRLCGDAQDAKDLVQETYLRAMSCEAHLIPGTNVGAWLMTIMQRLFIDQWRRRQRWSEVDISALEHGLAMPTADAEPTWSHVSAAELDAAIGTLTPPFRSVFQLHAVEHRSYREISSILGIPAATVGTRLARARQKLKQVLWSA
jgi:RNA polymerase sigma-70 factor, ECF subfamily